MLFFESGSCPVHFFLTIQLQLAKKFISGPWRMRWAYFVLPIIYSSHSSTTYSGLIHVYKFHLFSRKNIKIFANFSNGAVPNDFFVFPVYLAHFVKEYLIGKLKHICSPCATLCHGHWSFEQKERPIDQNAGILIIQICQKFLFCAILQTAYTKQYIAASAYWSTIGP